MPTPSRLIRTLSLLLAVCLLAGCVRAVWISPTEPSIADGAAHATLPAEFNDGWIIVETTINGRGPYRLILDTGAVYGVLGTELAEALGIEPAFEANITDSGGFRERHQVGLAEHAVIGPLTLTRVPFIISDNLRDLLARQGVDGVLGYPGFDRLTLDLDYPAESVRVSTERLRPGEPGITPLRRIRNDTPEVRLRRMAGDRPRNALWMAIDTGGELLISFEQPHSHRWANTDLAAQGGTAIGLAGIRTERTIAPVRGDLLIAGTRLTDTVAEIDKAHNLLGHELLRQFRVRIDNRGGLAAITPADPAADRIALPQPFTLGITSVAKLADSYLILSIARGSPAELAGVQPGDLIYAIDGVPVEAGGQLDNHPEPDAPPVVLTLDRDEIMIDLTLTPAPLFDPARTTPRGPDLTLPGVRIIEGPDGTHLEIQSPEGTILLPASPKDDKG
ncbi:MAG: aspartyl protease family protein [Phycisphaerales bacterium]|nr:aspartyl protease family protein [Planctomycetota bacterium]MCH8509447.1 aspartyl protease family protein [Phycisphaerales bacterium]